MYIIKL